MDNLYDVIIVGASSAGKYLFTKLLKANITNVALISNDNLPKKSSGGALIQDQAFHITYKYGIIGIALKESNKFIWGKKVIMATGQTIANKLVPEHFAVNYAVQKVKQTNNFLKRPILLWGQGDDFVKYALNLATKFSYIYLCFESEHPCSDKKLETIAKITPNMLLLGFCRPKTLIPDPKRPSKLKAVVLSSGSTVSCAQVLVQPKFKRDISWLGDQFFDLTTDQFVKVSVNFESTKIPSLYAVGTLIAPTYNKNSLDNFITMLLPKIKN